MVSREHVPHRDGGLRVARRTRALGRHDGDHRRQKAARGSALLVPGDKKRALKPPLVPALPERGRAHAQWRSAATRSHQAPPARASSIETRRCWLGTTPPKGRSERYTTAPRSVQILPGLAQNRYQDSAYLAMGLRPAGGPPATGYCRRRSGGGLRNGVLVFYNCSPPDGTRRSRPTCPAEPPKRRGGGRRAQRRPSQGWSLLLPPPPRTPMHGPRSGLARAEGPGRVWVGLPSGQGVSNAYQTPRKAISAFSRPRPNLLLERIRSPVGPRRPGPHE